MKIPPPIHTIASAVDAYHEAQQERPRLHLGASQLGHHCKRWIWLSFRWAVIEKFEGRILRLFRRGQNEEATVIADLKAIGCVISGTQDRVQFGGHVSGSLDGIIESGLPGAEKTPHVLEIKTHGRKSFDELEKAGSVKEAKPQHWAQMQVYMHGCDINRSLYTAVCKDDDRYYFERVRYDEEAAKRLIAKGHRLSTDDHKPPPISTDPTWYQCRWCPAYAMCHQSKSTQEINCRTCAHSTAREDGTWHCARWDAKIPDEVQYTGCGSHVLHPEMAPWRMVDGDGIRATYEIDGRQVVNGEGAVASKELVQC